MVGGQAEKARRHILRRLHHSVSVSFLATLATFDTRTMLEQRLGPLACGGRGIPEKEAVRPRATRATRFAAEYDVIEPFSYVAPNAGTKRVAGTPPSSWTRTQTWTWAREGEAPRVAARKPVCPSRGRATSVSGRRRGRPKVVAGGRRATGAVSCGPREARTRREGLLPEEAAGSPPLER